MSVFRRVGTAAFVTAILCSSASAQTMRFETSVGSFDMQLNPTNDPNLRPLVDNIVAYIGLGRYHHTAINRAPDGFVLQMGSFLGFPSTPNDFLGLIQEIERLDPVVVDGDGDGDVDFTAQSNTRGTVSLALSNNPNTGTSSFFINLGDNSRLDSLGFVPFARIVDMSTVDEIMDLEKTNLTGNPNDETFNNVPLTENDRLVILKSVHVLEAAPDFSFVGPVRRALEEGGVSSQQNAAAAILAETSTTELSSADDTPAAAPSILDAGGDGGEPAKSTAPLAAAATTTGAAVSATPEPSSLALAATAVLAASRFRRRRR